MNVIARQMRPNWKRRSKIRALKKVKCKCSGLPEPKWLKDGIQVSADARIKIKKKAGSYSLTCDKCTSQDQGFYQVQLANALGQVSASCTLSADFEFKLCR